MAFGDTLHAAKLLKKQMLALQLRSNDHHNQIITNVIIMNASLEFNQHRRIYAATLLCVAVATMFVYMKTPRENNNEGWKTSKELSQPFRESVITNGHEPANFEVTWIHPIQSISTKFSKPEHILVQAQVKFFDNTSVNSDIAPTSMVAHIRKGKLLIARKPLNPHTRKDLTFIYENTIQSPAQHGDYQLEIETKYSIYNFDVTRKPGEGMSIMVPLKMYKKLLEGVKIHVGN